MIGILIKYIFGVTLIYFVVRYLYKRYISYKRHQKAKQHDLEDFVIGQAADKLSLAVPYNNDNLIYNRQRKMEMSIQNNVNNQNLYNPYRFDANKKNDGENQKSAFISYPLLQNQSQTIYLKPYPLPQQPIDNIRKKIVDQTVRENKSSSTNKQNVAVKKEVNKNQNNNKKVPFNPFLKPSPPKAKVEDSTKEKVMNAPAKRYDLSSPTAVHLDPDSLQEEIFLKEYSIPWAELELKNVIGEGAYGTVYKGRWRGTPVAVKVINSTEETIVKDFKEEVYLLSSLRHPNISLFLAACLTPPHLALVTELATRGSLWDIIHTYEIELPFKLKVHIALDIAYGMTYLHSRKPPLLHRDLKSANILIDGSYRAKITDFGLARVRAKTEKMTGGCGTYQWMAPEVLDNKKYTEKADIYSYGILIWELYERKVPYDGKTGVQAAVGVLKRGLRPHISSDCPEGIVNSFLGEAIDYAWIMRKCWNTDPSERPCFPIIVQKLEALYQQLLEEEEEEEEEEE